MNFETDNNVNSIFKRRQLIAGISVSLGCVCAGSVLAWTSPVLPQITAKDNVANETTDDSSNEFYVSNSEAAVIGSLLAIGAGLASLPAGKLSDKIGRKKLSQMLTFLFIISLIITYLANNIFILYLARLLAGFAAGANCVCIPMYLTEIANDQIRGILGSLFQVAFSMGIFIVNVFGVFFNWKILSLALIIFPVINCIAVSFVSESYVYFEKIGNIENYNKVSLYLGGPEKISWTNYEETEKTSFKILISLRKNIKATLIGVGLVCCQQLSGVNAILFYTAQIFSASGAELSATVSSVLVTAAQLVMAFISAAIIDKRNRRFYLMISSLGTFISLIILSLYFYLKENNLVEGYLNLLPVISLVLFIITFSVGLGPIPWLMMGELFAPEYKAYGCGFVTTFNWSLVFLVTFAFPLIKKLFGDFTTFLLFSLFNFLAFLFCFFYVPETKGKSLKEVQNILSR